MRLIKPEIEQAYINERFKTFSRIKKIETHNGVAFGEHAVLSAAYGVRFFYA